MATKDADECDFGTGIPSSTRPRICISMASCIRSSASSRVFPVAMHRIVFSDFFDDYQEPVHTKKDIKNAYVLSISLSVFSASSFIRADILLEDE